MLTLATGLLAIFPSPASAERLRPDQIPPALAPWVDWVLRGHEHERCPELPDGNQVRCAWAGVLDLVLEAGGGRFHQVWQVHAETAVPLPGDRDRWPVGVLVSGRPAAVVEQEGRPAVRLPPGRHVLQGSFAWKRLPESLPVPAATGLVALRLGGRAVEFPRLAGGELFLEATTRPEADADRLEITVHRKLTDDVPLRLETRLLLSVAGKMREVLLGQALPPGFVAHAVVSDLPVRLEAGGRMRVQLRPGTFTVTLESRQPVPAQQITRPAPEGLWTAGDEVWVWQAQAPLRVVTISGVPAVDPRQTTLPEPWRALPAYLMRPGATLILEERRRGDAEPAPDQLTLNRQLWLDFDGGGYTARDQISGRLGRSWRLEMAPQVRLGRVSVAGIDQLITRLPAVSGPGAGPDTNGDGVEIRQGLVALQADSRIEGVRRRLPAVGWAHDFQAVSGTLHLPPGWRLLLAGGADQVDSTWIKRWTLLDLFLVLIVAISMARLFGRGAGLLALAMLVLIVQEPNAPTWIWLAVVLGEALVRALPAGQLRKLAKLYRLGAAVALLIVSFPFAVEQVRGAIHPALAPRTIAGVGFLEQGPGPGRSGREFSELEQEEEKAARTDSAPELRQQQLAEAASDAGVLNLLGARGGGAGSLGDVGGIGAGGVGKMGGAGIAGGRGAQPAPGVPGRPPGAPAADSRSLAAYDPNAQVQTGPGVPRWQWSQVRLAWNGPVERGAHLTFWLEPPWAVSLLALIGVALVALLALLLFRTALANPGAAFVRWLPRLPVLLLVLAAPRAGRAAEFPSKELLDELRAALLEKAACEPHCLSLGRLLLEATPQRLRLRLEATAAATAPVALPGREEHWLPATVYLDGQAATGLLRHQGRLWLLLPAGSHQIVLEGPSAGRRTLQIPLGSTRPHQVTATLNGWSLAGVAEDGAVGESLELTRTEAGSPNAGRPESFQQQSLPPFVSVERTLQLGLDWEVRTRVMRATPPGTAVVLEIPLLPNESVVSEGVKVAAGKVQVNLGPEEAVTEWRSVLAQKSPIGLTAPAASAGAAGVTGSWAEVWRLDLGPVWHAQTTGIPPIHPGGGGGPRLRTWRPWPGETVSIAVTRPAGVPGRTFTIDRSELALRPGARSTEATLTLQIRSSRGGEHTVTLPDSSTLESLQIDGRDQPLRLEGRRVTLPLAPGAQSFRLGFRTLAPLRLSYRTPSVDLGVPSVNADLQLALPAERWVLLLGGPRLGPAVLVWSVLVVIVIAGLLLGRSSLTPLRARHWILLGLGFAPLSVGAAVVVAGYFLALGWRRDHLRSQRAWIHNLVLLVLALWTIAAVGALFLVVQQGLLATPDMDVAGNGSHATLLHWTSDRVPGPLPTGWVVSLPLLAYHLTMLAWALWLAAMIIRWSRWVWSCFAEGGLWRPMFRRPPPAPASSPDP